MEGSGPGPDGGDAHKPVLRRLREGGQEPAPFRRPELRGWVLVTLAVLVLTIVLPLAWPATWPFVQRAGPLLSLFFLVAAGAMWLAPRRRAFLVSGVIVAALYGLTAWTPLAFDLEDFGVVALLSSFGVIALAGFNAVFVMEELVFDVHRLLEFRHRAWRFVPLVVVVALSLAPPLVWGPGSVPWLGLWFASLVGTVVLGGWWLLRAFNPVREGPVLVELHLFVAGILLIGVVTDGVVSLRGQTGLLPSLVAYLALVGTWVYVSYTTLQRTQFLLRGSDAGPWLCVLLSASFALLNHAFLHFRLEGSAGVAVMLEQRIGYLAFGLWVGVGFYVLRSSWRVLRYLRDDRRFTPTGRVAAGRLARIVERALETEHRLEDAAGTVYRRVDRALPGHEARREGWEFDARGGHLRRLDGNDRQEK